MTTQLDTPTAIPEGVKTYGPLEDYDYIPTDYGIYGLEGGSVMWFEPVTEFDQKEQRMVQNMYPRRLRVTPLPGPMDPLYYKKVTRKANLANYQTGRPSEFGQTEQSDTAAAMRELAASIAALVAQNTGTELPPSQVEVSVEDLVADTDLTVEELTEIAKGMKVEDDDPAPD